MKVFLLGFMGSGKSWLGRRLAQQLPFHFYDLDELIEQKEQRSIAQIFEESGEEAFRKIEAECLKDLDSQDNCLIALGGGTPCFYDNMDWILENGLSIYLKVTPQILVKRLSQEQEQRPLLQNFNSQELFSFVEQKISEREHYYNKANIHYLVNTGQEPILDELIRFTKAEFKLSA